MTYGVHPLTLPLILLLWMCQNALASPQNQQRDEARTLLLRARGKIVQSVTRLPKYLCTETIDRATFEPEAPVEASSCDELASKRKKPDWKVREQTSDRLRIDVAVSSESEMYSWVGENHFSDKSLADLVGNGPTSTGAFASLLASIFGTNVATFTYNGNVDVNGRPLAEFGFKVPVEKSTFTFGDKSFHPVLGYDGTFRIDPDTADLVELKVNAEALPARVNACESETTLTYGYTRLNGADFLIPTRTVWRVVEPDGKRLTSRTEFSGCHEFLGESTLLFDAQAAPVQASSPNTQAQQMTIPSGLSFLVALAEPIRTATAAAGDPIQARLASAIRQRHSPVLVPKGTPVAGRIVRIERVYGPKSQSLVVTVRLEALIIDGVRQPFSASLESTVRRRQRTVSGLIERQDLGSFDEMLRAGTGVLQFEDVTNDFVIPTGLEIEGFTTERPRR